MIKSYIKNGKKMYEVFVKQTDNHGKQVGRRKRGITSERLAKDAEYQLRKDLDQFLDNAGASWLWNDWLLECIHRMKFERKESTLLGYKKTLAKWLPKDWEKRELASFSKAEIFEFIFQKMDSSASAFVRKSVLKMLKRIFQMAFEDGLILKNPTQGISVQLPPSDQKVLTTEEAQKLLQEAQRANHRFYPIWAVALLSGMRSGEMYALKWTDIDFSAEAISVTKQWTSKDGVTPTKSRENRVVPISEDLKRHLLEIKNCRKDFSEDVLPHLREWTNGEQAQVLREFCRAIGITEVKFHDLRATFITNMLSQGVPLVTVMSIVGHRKMATTDVYVRLAGINVKGATEKLGYGLPSQDGVNVVKMGQR